MCFFFYLHHFSRGNPRLQTTLSMALSPSASSLIYTSTLSPKTSEQHSQPNPITNNLGHGKQSQNEKRVVCGANLSDSSIPSYQPAPITTIHSTWLSLVSLRALFWSMPLSPLEQNCFLLAAQPQMQAEETLRSAMCCRSRSDSHSFFVCFFSGLIYSCKLHIFLPSRLSSLVYFSSLFITSDSFCC